MKLDARTIVILLILGNLLMSGGLLAVARGYLGQVPGMSRWAMATLLQLLGWALFGVFRAVVPEVVSVALGSCMIELSLGLYLIILADFVHRPIRAGRVYALLGLQFVLLGYFVLTSPNFTPRIVINSVVGAILLLRSAHLLWHCEGRRPASHTFTMSMMAFCGTFLVLRAMYYAVWHTQETESQFSFSLINDVSYLIFFVTAVFLTFGFVLMCNERYLSLQNRALLERHELELKVRAGYDALKSSEMRLRRLMNSSLIGIIQGDVDGRLSEANEVLLQMTGYRHREMIEAGINWFDLTSPGCRSEQQQRILAATRQSTSSQGESQLQAKDGSLIPVMLGIAPLEGSHQEWVGFVVDLREQRRIDHLKSEFISIVSHELRTPLTSIRGSLGLLEGGLAGELPAKAMQLVMIAHKNSRRLVSLVNDILDMEKLASGKMNMHIQSLDLVLLARQALEANAAYADGFCVHYRLDTGLPVAMAQGDSGRLMQVFANLLSNAAKFSPAGAEVVVRVLATERGVRVEIEDHGKGIPQAFRNTIFGKFAQADASATRHLEGAGLGLHITKTLVEKMGGEIGFESEEGRGSLFWFILPDAPHNP